MFFKEQYLAVAKRSRSNPERLNNNLAVSGDSFVGLQVILMKLCDYAISSDVYVRKCERNPISILLPIHVMNVTGTKKSIITWPMVGLLVTKVPPPPIKLF